MDLVAKNVMVRFDRDRFKRVGFGEAVLAEGKTLDDLIFILEDVQGPLLVTRLEEAVVETLRARRPDVLERFVWNPVARTLRSVRNVQLPDSGEFHVAVVTGGTGDRFVAEEIRETLMHYGVSYDVFGDVGVAGLHRLLDVRASIELADCIICVAGMDGALASVVSGMVRAPVIGVPSSTGYGMSQEGQVALGSMLSSCASGLCVMNIDNGYGAAIAAIRIRNLVVSKGEENRD